MKFVHVPWADLSPADRGWIKQIEGMTKGNFRAMMRDAEVGLAKVWRLREPANGLAVTAPDDGHLFILYLCGTQLFDTLSPEDLLEVVRHEGCVGMKAEIHNPAMARLLKRFGFKPVGPSTDGGIYMELSDA